MQIILHTTLRHKIQVSVYFGADKTYSLRQNDVVINSGTYKTGTATSTIGDAVSSIPYTNNRIVDSAAYYTITDTDSLIISTGFIGIYGSGAKYYGKKKGVKKTCSERRRNSFNRLRTYSSCLKT